jgi:tetratricopeptide (TPR) repeat protein
LVIGSLLFAHNNAQEGSFVQAYHYGLLADSRTGQILMTDPLVGTKVAQYEVLAKLGGGGMGVVYAARDTKLERGVALKFLPAEWSHDESAKQRFIREAQAASATDHRNICTIHDIDTAPDGRLFIVMAQYDGPTLKQKLEQGPLPTEEAIEIAAQLAEGLARAHAQGVVHRDVKPGNIILTEDGLRIVDFGLARFAGSLNLTLEGSTLGTVAYMSPEQSRGDDPDGRSDIWSIGVVLYEMLTGELPFRGGYAEAITHAIRTEPTPALRKRAGENLDVVERVIRRALEKDPAQRYQSARDLARDLRLIQGRTLPMDLRTGTIPLRDIGVLTTRKRPWWRSRTTTAAAAVVVVALVAVGSTLYPIERIPIVVAPVVNQTGYAELDPYRLALTQELIAELSESSVVRVLSYDRLLQVIRRFGRAGEDVSSREALQAISANTGAAVIAMPTLLYENGGWKARVALRNASTATNLATFDSPPVVSSLVKETAYGLMPALASAIDRYGVSVQTRRAQLVTESRRLTGNAPPPPKLRASTLDVAAQLERAVNAYEQQEYTEALRQFGSAVQGDSRNPLILAWRGHVATVMREDQVAAESAQQAARLLTPQTPAMTAWFVNAVAAEAARDFAAVESHYQSLVNSQPDVPDWIIELAAFQDRRTRWTDAIATYNRALAIDGRLARPHLELCRLYNRRNELPKARQEAQLALSAYRALRHASGEALSLFCLSDALRVGTDAERKESREAAERALTILQQLRLEYNLPRAYYYVGLAAGEQGELAKAAALWEQAASTARTAGNVVLQPLVLMNLGVTYERLGDNARAAAFYRDSSVAYQKLGDERRAAQTQANAAANRLIYGDDPTAAVREIQNALAVARRLEASDFEAFCLQMLGMAAEFTGQYKDAELQMNRALAVAREHNLNQNVAWSTLGLARVKFETGDYAGARTLAETVTQAPGRYGIQARIQLGRALTRLGDVSAAGAQLTQAQQAQGTREDAVRPALDLALGALAYESGQPAAARVHFASADKFPADPLNESSIEARGYLGLLDAISGQVETGTNRLEKSLADAQKLRRAWLENTLRQFLSQVKTTRTRRRAPGT